MEDLYGIQTRRQAVEQNIEKAFGSGVNLNEEVEKARSGIYADTAENRRLNRVGQQYGGRKQVEQKTEKKVVNKENKENFIKIDKIREADTNDLKLIVTSKNSNKDLYNAAIKELVKRTGDKFSHEGDVLMRIERDKEYTDRYGKRFNIKFNDWSDGVDGLAGNSYFSQIESFLNGNEKERKNIIDDYKKYGHKEFKPVLEHCLKNGNFTDDEKDKLQGLLNSISKRNSVDLNTITPKASKLAFRIVDGLRHTGEGNPEFVPSKESEKALKKLRKTALEFAMKNPYAKLSDEDINEIIELPEDEISDRIKQYKGFDKLMFAIENYYEAAEEYDGDDEEYTKELEKRAKKASNDVILALEEDQGGLLNNTDEEKKKLKEIQDAAEEFMINNPDIRMSSEDWGIMVGGDEEMRQRYGHYAGFDKLNDVIEKYF